MKISKQAILQGLKQVFCIPYIYISHGFKLPQDSYCTKVQYMLPFEGEWTVINGGCEKEFSYSWNVPTQRYDYDFVIMDNNGKTYHGNSSEPHIHFHLQDGVSFFMSAGVPITFHNICISKKHGYENYDKRMSSDLKKSKSSKTKIHRGQQVSNLYNL